MAYATTPAQATRPSFKWDDADDVALFEDPTPAPVRSRATPSPRRAGTAVKRGSRSRQAAPCARCAAEEKARDRALPGVTSRDRIPFPARPTRSAILAALTSPGFVTTAALLVLAANFARSVTG